MKVKVMLQYENTCKSYIHKLSKYLIKMCSMYQNESIH